MRNRATSVLLAAVCLAIGLSGCASGQKIPVVSVSEILGIGPIGMNNRYAGVVEAGESVSVNKDASLEIAEVAVQAGDAVSKGQVLFSYETEALGIEVERMQLEIEQMNNAITTKKSQITTLEKEQKTADSANKLQYTLQIQQLQLDIKETEYKVTAKQKEIDRSKTRMADANVLSPVAGHVKEINANGETNPQTGEPKPFIVITQEGDFRVRGIVNEQNAGDFSVDMPVIIRSRTDESVLWQGVVSAVDWENPVQSSSAMMYGQVDEMTSSSKYPFYVKLQSDEGLMLGQHVYIEPDNGQMNAGEEGAGFYLPSYFICNLDTEEPYVWAADSRDKLEKRVVTLGNYNIESDSYEIMEGLALEDCIAYPDASCKAGAPVRYPGEEVPEEEEGESGEEGENFTGEEENGFIDGGEGFNGIILPDDGAITSDGEDFGGEGGLFTMPAEEVPNEDNSGSFEGGSGSFEGGSGSFGSGSSGSFGGGNSGSIGSSGGSVLPGFTLPAGTPDPGIAVVQGTEAVG